MVSMRLLLLCVLLLLGAYIATGSLEEDLSELEVSSFLFCLSFGFSFSFFRHHAIAWPLNVFRDPAIFYHGCAVLSVVISLYWAMLSCFIRCASAHFLSVNNGLCGFSISLIVLTSHPAVSLQLRLHHTYIYVHTCTHARTHVQCMCTYVYMFVRIYVRAWGFHGCVDEC